MGSTSIAASYKDEIHNNLNTIRKIVAANVADQNKKDNIYKKIAALALEVDREITTIDAVFGRFIDLSRTIGACAENVEPLVQKLESVLSALRDGADRIPLLPKKDRPKLLTSKAPDIEPNSKPFAPDLDDEIPF